MRQLDDELIRYIANILKVFSDPTRLKIIYHLSIKPMCVSELTKLVGGSQANISNHLFKLLRIGVVKSEKEGNKTYYQLCDNSALAICDVVCSVLESKHIGERKLVQKLNVFRDSLKDTRG